jgi:hypothetical protein
VPEEFDPAWEYWIPNPEIEEVMECQVDRPKDLLGALVLVSAEVEEGCRVTYSPSSGVNLGYRIGRGNPDSYIIEAEPPPPVIADYQQPKKVRRYECQHCGKPFEGNRNRDVYCQKCVPTSGAPRIQPVICKHCKIEFKPKLRRFSTYCSRQCAGKAQRFKPHETGCPYCGKEVTGPPSKNGNSKVYCSRYCSRRFRSWKCDQKRRGIG